MVELQRRFIGVQLAAFVVIGFLFLPFVGKIMLALVCLAGLLLIERAMRREMGTIAAAVEIGGRQFVAVDAQAIPLVAFMAGVIFGMGGTVIAVLLVWGWLL